MFLLISLLTLKVTESDWLLTVNLSKNDSNLLFGLQIPVY